MTRKLSQAVGNDTPSFASELSSWTCCGEVFHWHARNGRLYHDAPFPHGMHTTIEHRVLQALQGCVCAKPGSESMQRAKLTAAAALRSQRISYDRERWLGRGDPGREAQDSLSLARAEVIESQRPALDPVLYGWSDDTPLRDKIKRRIASHVCSRAHLVAHRTDDNWSVTAVVEGYDTLRLVIGTRSRPSSDFSVPIRTRWIVHALKSGLHAALEQEVILDACVLGFRARAMLWRGQRVEQGPDLSDPMLYRWRSQSTLIIADCERIDGKWTIRAEQEVARHLHDPPAMPGDGRVQFYRLAMRNGEPVFVPRDEIRPRPQIDDAFGGLIRLSAGTA